MRLAAALGIPVDRSKLIRFILAVPDPDSGAAPEVLRQQYLSGSGRQE